MFFQLTSSYNQHTRDFFPLNPLAVLASRLAWFMSCRKRGMSLSSVSAYQCNSAEPMTEPPCSNNRLNQKTLVFTELTRPSLLQRNHFETPRTHNSFLIISSRGSGEKQTGLKKSKQNWRNLANSERTLNQCSHTFKNREKKGHGITTTLLKSPYKHNIRYTN